MMKNIALVDERITEKCERSLEELGFSVLKLPTYEKLPAPLASHTDMLAFRLGDTLLFPKDFLDNHPEIEAFIHSGREDIKILRSDIAISSTYPHDAAMNALVLGNRVFARKGSVCPDIIRLAESLGFEVIFVNQGYPACTVLPLGNAAVTADEGMRRAIAGGGAEVYKINDGGIALPPYEYGFIGGACGVFEGVVYTLGDIDSHPDAAIIKAAIAREGLSLVSLSDEELRDLGGILFI
jgi:hypothetical protein